MRIIAGLARGARLRSPKGLATRPTADRVKESLFSILGERVRGRRVLDLFAGTGSLGLEALSRGARDAVFVDRTTASVIEANAAHTHFAELSRVLRADVFAALSRLAAEGASFGLVFCDPPYGKGLWERALGVLDASRLLADDAIVVAECGGDEGSVPSFSALALLREAAYGKTTRIRIFGRRAESAREADV